MQPNITITGVKAERIASVVQFSPQLIQETEMSLVRNALADYYATTANLVEDLITDEEQDKDSKQLDKRENPKAHGRLKPTRKGDTQETKQEGE